MCAMLLNCTIVKTSYSLITGGLGLIGTFLAKELLNKKKQERLFV